MGLPENLARLGRAPMPACVVQAAHVHVHRRAGPRLELGELRLWRDVRRAAVFQSHGKVRARPGPSGEALCMAPACKRHGVNDATRSLRV